MREINIKEGKKTNQVFKDVYRKKTNWIKGIIFLKFIRLGKYKKSAISFWLGFKTEMHREWG